MSNRELKTVIYNYIKSILTPKDYVLSATVVGSFVTSKALEGISDIDVVIIVDDLDVIKFNNIIVKGTTIKSAFVDYFLSKKILFFIDDDKKKIGQKFNSKKIFSFSKNMINKKDMHLIDTTKDFI